MEEYKVGPGVIDETVKVAKKFLEEHPEETGVSADTPVGIGADIICSFLNWKQYNKYNSHPKTYTHEKV
jgi:hypothetical protein